MVIAITYLVFDVMTFVLVALGKIQLDSTGNEMITVLVAGGIIGICNRLDKIIRILGERVEK